MANSNSGRPAFIRSDIDGEGSPPMSHMDWLPKRKRNFEVVDANELYALYPQFFKLVPDYAKIRQAIKLGLPMPGVKFDSVEGEEPDEEIQFKERL